jgi:hypothetical protein
MLAVVLPSKEVHKGSWALLNKAAATRLTACFSPRVRLPKES